MKIVLEIKMCKESNVEFFGSIGQKISSKLNLLLKYGRGDLGLCS